MTDTSREELRDLAKASRAVAETLLTNVTGKHFVRIAEILEGLAVREAGNDGVREALFAYVKTDIGYREPELSEVKERFAALALPQAREAWEPDKLRLFLSILASAGGETSGYDWPGNWINYFCEDAEPLDTFNQASDQKLTRVTHDSDSDTSVVYLTQAGKDYLAFPPRADAPGREEIARKALEMRGAIDMIEGALMRWPDLMDLPEKWQSYGGPRHRRELGLRLNDVKGNCGQLYDIYDAMMECNRIINSDEFNPNQFSTTPQDGGDDVRERK